MVNKPATANRMLHKVSKSSLKVKKVKEETHQVQYLLHSLNSIIPSSANASENMNPEINVIENAVSYIQKLKSQLSNEEIMMLDQMFSFATTVNKKVIRNPQVAVV